MGEEAIVVLDRAEQAVEAGSTEVGDTYRALARATVARALRNREVDAA